MFSFLHTIYIEGLYRPLFNILVFLYNSIPGHDIGVAIIILTLFIRALLYPWNAKALKANKIQQEIQPKITEIREKYKDDKEKQSQEMMKLYSHHKVNPLSSCLPLLVQMPILIALYRVFFQGLTNQDLGSILYPFIHNPGTINPFLFGWINLAAGKNIILAVVAGALQFWQSWMMMAKVKKKDPTKEKSSDPTAAAADAMQGITKNMMYIFPLLTVWFGYTLPAGLSLYWVVTTIFTIAQQYLIDRGQKKKDLVVSTPAPTPPTTNA